MARSKRYRLGEITIPCRRIRCRTCRTQSRSHCTMLRPSSFVLTIFTFTISSAPAYCAALQQSDTAPIPHPRPVVTSGDSLPEDRLRWHIPDPEHDRQNAAKMLEEARARGDNAQVTHITRVAQRV